MNGQIQTANEAILDGEQGEQGYLYKVLKMRGTGNHRQYLEQGILNINTLIMERFIYWEEERRYYPPPPLP